MKIFGRILGVLFVIAVMLLCVCSAFSQTSGNTPPPPPVCGSTNAGAIYTDTGTTPPTVYTCSYYNLEWQWNVNPIYGGLVYESSVPGTCSGALPVYVAGWPNTEVYVCENGIPEPIPSPGETVGVSGSITNGNCASWSSSNSITDAGFPCGSSSGTVSSGTAGQLAVYTGTTTVAGTSSPMMASATVAGALNAGAFFSTWNFASGFNGAACNDATDDTAAFQALVNTVGSAGGGTIRVTGTCLISGQVVFPASASSPWTMPPIRILSAAPDSPGTADNPSTLSGGGTLDARYAGIRFLSLGQGRLEIDHVNIINGGTNCGTFFYTTLTNLELHDVTVWGGNSRLSACDDVWIAGGNNPVSTGLTGTANDYFQGYGSYVDHVIAHRVRTFIYGRVAFNSISITNNQVWKDSGSNLNTIVASATNANPVVLTVTGGHQFPTSSTFNLTFVGATGNWTPLNGVQTITVLSATTFSVPINSTSFGSLTGSLAYYDGAAIIIDGTANSGSNFSDTGNYVSGNLFETVYYPFAIALGVSGANELTGNSFWDTTGFTVASIWQQSGATASVIDTSHSGGAVLLSSNGQTNGSSVRSGGGFVGPIIDTIYGTGSNNDAIFAEQGTLATNNQTCLAAGLDYSAYDSASFCFENKGGTGSSTNQVGISVSPGEPMLTWSGTGALGVGGTGVITLAGVTGSQPAILYDINGTQYWNVFESGADGYYAVTDSYNSNLVREQIIPNSNFNINAGAGTGSLRINMTNGSGTGGFQVGSGGTTAVEMAGINGAGIEFENLGTAVASATTMTLSAPVTHITGTATINSISVISNCNTAGFICHITLIPDGIWSTNTAGNIAAATTAIVGKPILFWYDPSTAKWYPSY